MNDKYLVIYFDETKDTRTQAYILNKYASEGWRLITVVCNPDNIFFFYFERIDAE